MIHLDRVELLHWDMQPHQVLPLARGVTLITGENGSGKTSILDAIKVGLGVRRLEGDRTIEGYLLNQAAPLAMIRILVDNRPEPGTRRRPFDPLGEHSEDVVTLAVVFRADDDGHYGREYYILDGDVVPLPESPLTAPRPYRPLPAGRDYRERLQRVGIGRQYLKLLGLPQGQISNLCKNDGERLFEALYDIIGGRDALEAWEQTLADLKEKEREHKAVQDELKEVRSRLHVLEQAVRRHGEFVKAKARLSAVEQALPHVEILEARAEADGLARSCKHLGEESEGLRDDVRRERVLRDHAHRRFQELQAEFDEVEAIARKLQARRDLLVNERAQAQAHWATHERLREKAEGVAAEDIGTLEEKIEEVRALLAGGQAEERDRAEEIRRLAGLLARVERGLIPFPDDVEPFREALRRAGIPHHVLAEVIEVRDERWMEAVEGFLGRYRFAILVQDPASWAQAARLAREHRYPHGVLAPDVRSHSPADDEGLGAIVEVREARYKQLVARLIRRVAPGEPPEPLEPPRKNRLLAEDGFLLTRIEARYASAEQLYLGREALRRRKITLEAELRRLGETSAAWKESEKNLRGQVTSLEERLSRQRMRLQWEAVRDEWSSLRALIATKEGEVESCDQERAALDESLKGLRREMSEKDNGRAVAEAKLLSLGEALAKIESELEDREKERTRAEQRLGHVLSSSLEEPSDEARGFLEQGLGARGLQAMENEVRRQLAGFSEAERDPMLPVNFERQQGEVEAVEGRLNRLHQSLEGTLKTAEDARDHYQQTTRRVFRAYFGRLDEAAKALDFGIDGKLEERESGRFACDIRIRVGDKPPVRHDSDRLSGGQKAALSILMSMSAVSMESESAGFFLIDEPFSQSDIQKINELGHFLERTGAQYLVSMPTSSDLESCADWLEAVWICTKSRGGFDSRGRPVLATPLRMNFADGARDG
ncbi:MAG: AAA family ATPase [Bradymonadaceae bacterium]